MFKILIHFMTHNLLCYNINIYLANIVNSVHIYYVSCVINKKYIIMYKTRGKNKNKVFRFAFLFLYLKIKAV